MNKRVLYTGISYCCLVIIFKLIILLGGYQFTRFGFYFSHIVSVFFVIPFMILAIILVRDKDWGGKISGKQAITAALGVAGIAMLLLSIYHYLEFEWKLKELSAYYYNSEQYLDFLKKNPAIKPETYSSIIKENIAGLSSFRAVTAKLFSFLIISVSSAFVSAVFLKRS